MKLIFLGTSHGIPTEQRFCSSAALELDGKLYLIDAGAPIVDMLLRCDRHPGAIRAVFCTHHHGDHTDGLLNLTDLCGWAYKTADFDVYVTREEQAELIPACVALASNITSPERLRYHVAHEGELFDDGHVKITYIPTRHCEPYPSYAVLVEAEGKRLLFTGDLSGMIAKNDFPSIAMECETELVVCEMAHFGKSEIEPYAKALKTRRLIFNHVNFPEGMDKFADIEKMASSGEYPFPISAAYDGEIIEI